MLGPKINRVTVDLPANLVFPKMIRAHLEMGTTSCATGYDRNILKRSLGEALERHISFSDADTGGPDLTLSEMDPFIAEWFQRYCRMNIGEYPSLSHRFTTTEVTDLSTEKKYFAPLIAFNLGKSQDEEIFGYRDSSGTALHQSHTMAFTGSRDEFCERQSLTLFWYFGHCLSSIELSKKKLTYEVQKLGFVGSLLDTGSIFLFDISYFNPVRTILSVYVSDSGKVRFAAGASGNEDINEAVSKALLEMYQTFVLMTNITDKRATNIIDVRDPLIGGFLSHNTQNTVDKFLSINHNSRVCPDSFYKAASFEKEFIHEPVFLHQKEIIFTNKKLYFCVMKSIYGFKNMSLNDKYVHQNLAAARHYGYNIQVNSGPVPFA